MKAGRDNCIATFINKHHGQKVTYARVEETLKTILDRYGTEERNKGFDRGRDVKDETYRKGYDSGYRACQRKYKHAFKLFKDLMEID